jgi:ribosomal protein S18 acetylase RimI-like enzyme
MKGIKLTRFVIRQATFDDIGSLSVCFDDYRVFYKQESDVELARRFLTERLENRDSTIFVALVDDVIVGFVQLYPSFTSVGTQRILILNDLFINEASRGVGAARALMTAADVNARETGCLRLTLSTARDNFPARSLYESVGYTRDQHYYTYDKIVG